MVATAYAKSANGEPVIVRPLDGGLASPGGPLRGIAASFSPASVLEAGRLQATHENAHAGRVVAGGKLLCATLTTSQAVISDLGDL